MEIIIVKLILFATLVSIVSAVTVNLNEFNNPITSYTTGIRGRVESLSAKICPRHIRTGDDRNSTPTDIYTFMDELKSGYRGRKKFVAGHIISYTLGGTFERYNYYPQDSSYNHGEWAKAERMLVEYIRQFKRCNYVKFDFVYNRRRHEIPTRINFRIDFSDGRSYSNHDDQTL